MSYKDRLSEGIIEEPKIIDCFFKRYAHFFKGHDP